MTDRGVEYLIQNLLYEAAGEDHLLQPDELRCYVEANPLEWRQFAVMLNRPGDRCRERGEPVGERYSAGGRLPTLFA